MYNDFFGLKETPFTISPDPRYLFMSERHRDALAHLLYGIGAGGGFVLLTGEVGTGKTTVCRCLLEQLPANVRLAYILNPKLNAIELMATMCDELGIEYDKGENSLKTFTDLLSNRLLDNHDQGLNTVLMIDEAQNLSVEVLEQIRLLTNLETNQKKLLQIILIGQPELQELLAKKELRQLAQRITARYHLRPLSLVEVKSYIEHRLRIAGVTRPIFKDAAIKLIHKSSQGIPRLINVISDRSLLGAFSEHRHQVDVKTVQKAVDEVMGNNAKPLPQEDIHRNTYNSGGIWKWATFAMASLLIVAAAYWFLASNSKSDLSTNGTSKQLVSNDDNTSKNSEEVAVTKAQSLESQNTQKTIEKTADQIAQDFWGEQSWDRTGNVAAKNLLALWGVEYLPFQSSQACQFAENYTLSCDDGVADWNFLSQLNRPANLKFSTENTGAFWGTLLALEGDMAILQFGDNQVRIAKKKLNPLWSGEYQLFWKKPIGFSGHMSVGSTGVSVVWLTQQIEHLDGLVIQPANRFSQRVEEWVLNFQQRNNLLTDGIIGKHTVMMINNETVANIPKLVNKDITQTAEVSQ
ncbi:MAG: AAA family ATPase [Kangiellaceae bacterium]|nr:AAA family ATPase [Kangiellaceae bacterium]